MTSTRRPVASKGFTLVEIAVTMAVVAILASAALPRMGDMRASAQATTLRDFKSKLQTAASTFAAEQGRSPDGFEFLDPSSGGAVEPKTISFNGLQSGVSGITCAAPTGNTFTCSGEAQGHFSHIGTVTFSVSEGLVTGEVTTAGTGNGALPQGTQL